MIKSDTSPSVLWTLTQPNFFNLEELRDRVKWLRDHYPYADMDEADKEDAEAELQDLEPVLDQFDGCASGSTFYREDWWLENYAEEEAENFFPGIAAQSWLVIDWDKTGDNLYADFEEIAALGTTYYVRSW